MAYQPKSYKKFVATAATATLVATAVAPSALAADFTDVNANYKNAVDYLVDQGIAQGFDDTTFGTTSPIKRGDAAVMIAKALGLNTATAPSAGFTDLNARVAGAVNAIVAEGIASGKTSTTFAPDLYITRQEMAKMIANAYGLSGESVENTFTDVNDNWDEYVDALLAAGITFGYNETTFGATDDVTRGQFALFVYRAEGSPYEVPTVSSLAINAEGDEFTLVFAEELPEDADLSYVLENYEILINGQAPSAATVDALKLAIKSVSADRKTVVVSHTDLDELASALGGTSVELKIGGKAATYTFDLEPKVNSVERLNAKQLVVKFNVPVNTDETVTDDASELDNYKLDGINASKAVVSADKKSVTLTFDADVEGENQVLVVEPTATNSKDANGNWIKTEKYSTVFTYTDTVKPTVTSTTYANNVVTLQFSEELSVLPTVVRVNGTPVTTYAFDPTDSSKVLVTTSGLTAGSTASLYVAGAKDSANTPNEMDLFTGSVVVPAADNEKPRVTAVSVTGQNTLKLTVSEDITQNSFPATLQRGAVQSPVTFTADTTDTTGKTYVATVDLNGATAGDGIFSGTSTSETFTLFVAAETLTDSASNKNDFYSTSVTFAKDTTAPALVSTQTATENKKLEFTFNEALTVVGADSSIIITNGEGVRLGAVAAETELKTGDNKTYQVDFAAGDVALPAGTYSVSIPAGFFTDQYGNATGAVSGTFTIGTSSSTDTVKPTATVTNVEGAKNTFNVAFSEEVTGTALNLANYRLDGQALPAGSTIYFTSTAKNNVVIALPAESINIGNQTLGAPAVLTVSNVTDKAGNAMNSANYNVTVNDNTAATITATQVIGTEVYVTFSENVSFTGPVDANNVFDVKVNGTVVEAGDIATVAGNLRQVRFTLADVPTATPVVTVKANQTLLTDANGYPVR